ncbi:TetR family transcriptional regulator [Microbispora rosea subsp. aerata]|nr:TetR/AcrR family transcriptional regulator [Microbispora rosea]GGO12009.1 TetR family transcriptional regulator [Microbispora rosea subsp. aerata]GIH55661.1 TetR family transcriptional regulator [Microbispora rosea subsp. aerata]GLJ86041.1 TetR family transcriptional regulator [Microbispora rosea subsp. aerata]
MSDPESETPSGRDRTRAHIVSVAARLLASGGRDALSTRSVAAAAGTQAPTIYRLFGDKEGLLDAVAEYGFNAYLRDKKASPSAGDPVEELRAGWDLHVGFGLANPALFSLMYGDPKPGRRPPAAVAAFRMLRERIRAIAAAGRLKVGERLAADLVHAAGCGTVFTLLALPEKQRDPGLSEAAREAAIAAVTTDAPVVEATGPAAAAMALLAALPDATALTDGERHVLGEWLDRLAGDASG